MYLHFISRLHSFPQRILGIDRHDRFKGSSRLWIYQGQQIPTRNWYPCIDATRMVQGFWRLDTMILYLIQNLDAKITTQTAPWGFPHQSTLPNKNPIDRSSIIRQAQTRHNFDTPQVCLSDSQYIPDLPDLNYRPSPGSPFWPARSTTFLSFQNPFSAFQNGASLAYSFYFHSSLSRPLSHTRVL